MKRIRFTPLALAAVAALACTPDGEEADDVGEATLEVTVPEAPAGINCMNVQLVDANGLTFDRQVTLDEGQENRRVLRAVPSGAYEVSATAYSATPCSDVPPNPPWGTAEAISVIIQSARVEVMLVLHKTGSLAATPVFSYDPLVVARDQGPMGAIAASGDHVAWVTEAGVRDLFEDGSEEPPVRVIADHEQRPLDINIGDDDSLFWTLAPSAAGAGDAAVWRYSGGAAPIATGQGVALEIAAVDASQVYWNGPDQIMVFDGFTAHTQVANQPGNNAITLNGSWLYWTIEHTGVIRRANADLINTIYAPPAPVVDRPTSVATDGTYVYFTTMNAAARTGSLRRTLIDEDLDDVEVLASGPGVWFNAEVHGGFVYFVNGGRFVGRVPSAGGDLEILQHGGIGGLALTSRDGEDLLYFTDGEWGGVVWRLQLTP